MARANRSMIRDYADDRQPFAAVIQPHAPAECFGRTTGKVLSAVALAKADCAHDALADDRHFQRCRRVV